MYACSCLCSSSFSLSHGCVPFAGLIMVLPSRQLQPDTPRSNVSSSHALHAIAPLVASPPTWSLGVGPAPPPVRPWHEVKSRRGAPKRVNTEGFACPNKGVPRISAITDAQIHALVGDGTHGHAERIQTFRCQACHTTFTARHDTPLYRLKTPSQQVAVVLTALAEGLDPSAAERVFGYRQATITTWLSRAGEHAQILHERSFRNLWLPHLQLDELRKVRSASHRTRSCRSGWPSTPALRFFQLSNSAPARKTRRIGSSILCDRSWLLAVSRSSRVMA